MPVDQNTLAKLDQCRSRFVKRLAAKIEKQDLRWVEFGYKPQRDRAGFAPGHTKNVLMKQRTRLRHRENR